jgi:hypothetical protein
LDYTNIRPKAKGEKMKKSTLLVSLAVFILLIAVAAFTTTQVAALRPSGSVGNQVFYSPGIASFIPTVLARPLSNQEFYSPFVASIVSRVSASVIRNQVLYSPYLANLLGRGSMSAFPNQVFYSPMIESIIH